MIDNCTLYLNRKNPPINKVLPDCKSDGGLLRKATQYEYTFEGERAQLNIMPEADLEKHLKGLQGYVFQLPNAEDAKADALERIGKVESVLGVNLAQQASPDSQLFHTLFYLLQVFGGFMFFKGNIVLGDMTFLVGPNAIGEHVAEIDESIHPEDFRHMRESEDLPPELLAMRERHYFSLAQRRFLCARWLPLESFLTKQLRPLADILGRVNALNVLFHWVVFPQIEEPVLQAFIEKNHLQPFFTPSEQEILALPRSEAHETQLDNIGWKLENMWALCWVLGFDPAPPFYQGQMHIEISQAMILQFLPNFYGSSEIPAEQAQPRTLQEVGELEDLYYCAHNAVRSAQTGKQSVPQDFHPIADGGAIAERRHALTWCLSPGVDWDDTDLST